MSGELSPRISAAASRVVVRGAREHNLKNIDLAFPRDRLVVITGPSGAGKSSLAFDTLYAEGQRRYVEALSMRARQHLERLPRADVDLIEGLPPAIGVRASDAQASGRATVGTTTELHELLGLLFARVGQQHCPRCGTRIEPLATAQMVDRVLALAQGTRVSVRAPLLRDDEADLPALLQGLRKDGYARVVLDGRMIDLGAADGAASLPKRGKHSLDVDVDRIAIKPGVRGRLADSIELALRVGKGAVRIAVEGGEQIELSTGGKCLQCGLELSELMPESFSFQSPRGACEACGGLGERRQFQPELVVPEPELSLRGGAIAAWGTPDGRYYARMLAALLEAVAVDADVAFGKLPARMRERVLNGGKGYEGVLAGLERRLATLEQKAQDDELDWLEQELGQFMQRDVCERCHGSRLNARALGVRVAERNLGELLALQLDALLAFCAGLQWPAAASVVEPIMAQVRARLSVIVDLGLGYLSLGRSSRSLSRGEAERIRLAAHLGGGLCGVLYVLDEPTTGLHPRDTARLLRTLQALRDRGNSVLVVEHDLEMIAAADHVLELGPGAGALGGRVLASCTPAELQGASESVTAVYLRRSQIAAPARTTRATSARRIEIRDARTHNLRGVDADIPIGRMTCVTGVSGSGKTSLVMHTLLPAVRSTLRREAPTVAATIKGLEPFGRVVHVDQAPIGRSPRSIPATYAGLFGPIRALFSELPEARARGYGAERFSFNVKGGRCERCQGAGQVRVDMQFLPDAYVLCEVCGGARFDRETLEVRYRGRSIADVLAATIDDASELFGQVPKLAATLAALRAVGLGYLSLGQSATALSSGEAQRLRLAKELARRGGAETLYLLDEPSAGLHPSEVELLARVLEGLTEEGHTVVLVEHHLELALASDWVIDLGPEGGEAGGRVLAAGSATDVARCPASHTGHYLARRLGVATG